MATIDLVLDESLFENGISKYIPWDYIRYPHMVIFGSTGSGKTYLLKIILGRIAKHINDASLIICDFKSDDDFAFLEGCSNFYRYDKCIWGLEKAVEILMNRQQKIDTSRSFVCLVFDEWASFVTNLDKKTADAVKQKLSLLLMLGRSFNIHVIVSQQRLDATYFNSARDNFSVVCGMGVLSKEAVEMMFHEYKDEIIRSKSQGHGSAIIGNQFRSLLVPVISNILSLHQIILSAIHYP